jgi:hypothetical protein
MRFKLAVTIILTALALTPGAHAQGCALCYTTASSLGAAAQRSLDWGILALVTPALTLFAAVIFTLYRRANSATA